MMMQVLEERLFSQVGDFFYHTIIIKAFSEYNRYTHYANCCLGFKIIVLVNNLWPIWQEQQCQQNETHTHLVMFILLSSLFSLRVQCRCNSLLLCIVRKTDQEQRTFPLSHSNSCAFFFSNLHNIF